MITLTGCGAEGSPEYTYDMATGDTFERAVIHGRNILNRLDHLECMVIHSLTLDVRDEPQAVLAHSAVLAVLTRKCSSMAEVA